MSPDFDTVLIRGKNPDKPQQIVGKKKVPKKKMDDGQEMPPTVLENGQEVPLSRTRPLHKPADVGIPKWLEEDK